MGGDVANLSPKARGADRDFQSNKVRCLTWRTEESAIRIMRMEGLLGSLGDKMLNNAVMADRDDP